MLSGLRGVSTIPTDQRIDSQSRDGHGESFLNLLQDLLILGRRNERDTQTLGTESTSSTDSVQVRVGVGRSVLRGVSTVRPRSDWTHIVDHDVDTLDIDTTTENVGSHQDSLLERLERFVSGDSTKDQHTYTPHPKDLPLSLVQCRVNGNRRKVALAQQSVELLRTVDRLDENADLVELEVVQQVVQLSVLGILLELDVVLLQTVQGELGLVVDKDFQGLRDVSEAFQGWANKTTHVLHKLSTGDSDFLAEGGTEHHDLLVSGCSSEDFLNIPSHVWAESARAFPPRYCDSPSCSNILSHSSRTNILTVDPFNALSRTNAFNRPGVPTTMCGHLDLSFKISMSCLTGVPP